MLVDDHRLLYNVDALLRADRITQLASDAAFAHIVSRYFLRCFSYGEAVPDDVRRIADIKILAVRFIQAKHFQGTAGIAGIDGLHIGVSLENLIQLLTADIFDLPPQGNRDFVLGGRQGDIALLHRILHPTRRPHWPW